MALKDAGVRRAKLGDCEFEFPVELESESAPEPVVVIDRIPAQTVPDIREPVVDNRPGYARLFGENAPRFKTPA